MAIFLGLSTIVNIALTADCINQRRKRKRDLQEYQKDLANKDALFADKEALIKKLVAILGEQHEMVRGLMAELSHLRAEVAAM